MTDKFTKGPWEIAEVNEYDGGQICGSNEPVTSIFIKEKSEKFRGTIAHLQSAEHIAGITRQEVMANAPELLEALEELRKWQQPCGQDPEIDAALRKADEAIAKARGQS